MKIKTEILKYTKNRERYFFAWLAVLAAVVFLQIGQAYWQKAPIEQTKGQNSIPIPMVLGAVSDLRGQAAKRPAQTVVPALAENDLAAISAKSYLVYEQASGQVILEKNPTEKLPIASLTKLMTGLLAYENLDFNNKVTISRQGLTSVSPAVNFINGDQVSISDVFDSMIVGSCNDAAQILGDDIENVTGKSIVGLMNQKAAELGMSQSNFSNPLGFDIGSNYSTALDLKKLVDETSNYAAFSNLGLKTSLSFSGSLGHNYQVRSTNSLLNKYPDILAVKTGYTENARGSMIIKVSKDGHSLVIIVLNSQDRESDVVKLKTLIVDKLKWM